MALRPLTVQRSGDVNVTDFDGAGARAQLRGELAQRLGLGGRLDAPPDRVAAGQAGRRGARVPQGAPEALPRGERGGAFAGLVEVKEEEERHGSTFPPSALPYIGDDP